MAVWSSFYFTIGGTMEEQKSFKERVKESVIQNAYSYKKYFVDYEYLLCSAAFVKNEYYIVSAYEDNYLRSVIKELWKKLILIFVKMDKMKKK